MFDSADWKGQVIPDVSGLSVLFQSLLKIDTRTGHPGVDAALDLIKNYCIQSDLDYVLTDPYDGPDSIIIKIKGREPDGKGLILLSHLDTAGWNLKNWRVHPLSAKKENGKIYGRGAIDCKSLTAIWLHLMKYIRMTMPARDIVLVITSDEESGGESGLKWITENTELLKGCNSALNEGGGYIMPASGNKAAITCQYGEKGKIVYPLEPTDNTKEIFVREAGLEGVFRYLQATWHYNQNIKKFKGCRIKPDFKNSFFNSITVLNNFAEMSYLPKADLKKKIITLEGKGNVPKLCADRGRKLVDAAVSSLRTKLFRIILNHAKKLGMDMVPVITRGYSDSRYLRCLGINTYGFFPIGKREEIKSMHGPDEHIHENSLHEAFRILFSIIRQYNVWNS